MDNSTVMGLALAIVIGNVLGNGIVFWLIAYDLERKAKRGK